jgi:predicted ABC-type ATPase
MAQGKAGKDIVILGGPNGAGKTTLAQVLVPKTLRIKEFVNADEIARGLSPFNAEGAAVAAGRAMLKRIRDLVDQEESFALETTLSGRTYVELFKRCRRRGWRIWLIYLWLESPEMAVDRVEKRVRQGGHGISKEIILRRYWAGLANLQSLYLPLAHMAKIYDNSDRGRTLISEQKPGGRLLVYDEKRWARIVTGSMRRR